MLYAVSTSGEKVLASPQSIGTCPHCDAALIPKCGAINQWHWSHRNQDCDHWSEPETEWHRGWKALVKREACEVFINGHRADIVGIDTLVVELQHSSISPEEIEEREAMYDDLIWIFDASEFARNVCMRMKVNSQGKEYFSFRWKHARKRQLFCQKLLIWDFGEAFEQLTYIDMTDYQRYYFPARLFVVNQFYQGSVVSGWGFFLGMEDFLKEFLGEVLYEQVEQG